MSVMEYNTAEMCAPQRTKREFRVDRASVLMDSRVFEGTILILRRRARGYKWVAVKKGAKINAGDQIRVIITEPAVKVRLESK